MGSCSSTFQHSALGWGSSWLSDLASIPVVSGLHHPAGMPQVTAAQAHHRHSRWGRSVPHHGGQYNIPDRLVVHCEHPCSP